MVADETNMRQLEKRGQTDRRSGPDRRVAHDLEYFEQSGVERRSNRGRRELVERRTDWARINHWSSVRIPRCVYV